MAENINSMERYSSIIKFAGDLIKNMNLYWIDLCEDYACYKENKEKIYFAIDTDVMNFFLEPSKNYQFAKIFSEMPDKDEFQKLLALRLGNFIFLNNKGLLKDKLFIIPPHDEEIRKYLFSLTQDYANSIKIASTEFDDIFKHISSETDDDSIIKKNIVNTICDSTEYLLDVLDGQAGAANAVKRFNRIDSDRVHNIIKYTGDDSLFPKIPGDIDYTKWKHLLNKYRYHSANENQIKRDAIALSIVEFINNNLNKKNARLILITCTKSIIKAAKHYWENGKFAKMYIRHPNSFIMDNHFFKNVILDDLKNIQEKIKNTSHDSNGSNKFEKIQKVVSASNLQMIDYINLLFPEMVLYKSTNCLQINKTELNKLDIEDYMLKNIDMIEDIFSIIKKNSEFSDDNKNVFTTTINSVLRQSLMTEEVTDRKERADKLIKSIKELLSKQYTIKEIKKELLKEAWETFGELISATTILTIMNSNMNKNREETYGIPALRFYENFSVAQEVLEYLYEQLYVKDSDEINESNIKEQYTILENIDPEKYLIQIIHAYFYACHGHWSAAKKLCIIALMIANNTNQRNENKNNIEGREAAYLLSIAEMRMAKSKKSDDFNDSIKNAKSWLDEARKNENKREIKDERFTSQDIAISTALLNYKWFITKDADIAKMNEKEMNESIDHYKDLIDKIFELQERLENQLNNQKEEVRHNKNYYDWVFQQSTVNLLNIVLIWYYISEKMLQNQIETKLKEKLKRFGKDKIEHNYYMFKDNPSHFMILVGLIIFSDNTQIKVDAYEELKKYKLGNNKPFDTQRDSFFRTMANSFMLEFAKKNNITLS